MSRVVWLVMDSVGIGALPDAQRFGDAGADTLGHIAQWCLHTRGRALQIPTLAKLGLGHAYQLVNGQPLSGVSESDSPQGCHGAARERSTGKDTVSGHWELCGLPVDFDWGYFEARSESFPPELLQAIAQAAGTEGVLGNCHASGTEIIAQLGEQHLRSGWPIVYTSADSVLQIAAHETAFGLQRLYALCEVARSLVDPYRIGRVIARPFVGGSAASFKRTPNRHDYATPPTAATLLDVLKAGGRDVIGIGKIGDIFAMQGITDSRKASGLEALMQVSREALQDCADGGLVFTNLVDFDQEYGHRRDVAGYAEAMERFDALLPALIDDLRDDDLLLLCADHGNDPTWRGNDHTREHIPVLAFARGRAAQSIGLRESFADVGQSIATWLRVPALSHGHSFL